MSAPGTDPATPLADPRAVLQVERLVTTVRIGEQDVPAVNDVSFAIRRGQTLGLVGESGCGKSLTAMSILRLLDEPHVRVAGGRILFGGEDLARLPEARLRRVRGNRIAMIFQEPSTALNPVLTIGDQVAEPLQLHEGMSAERARAAAVELLGEVGIPAAAERARAYPHQLSGGMKQRAMIAMALACKPDLLIADEPTTALDVTVQAQILALLARLRAELGMALLLITHDLGVVAETCDEVAVMYAGRIVEQAPAGALFAAPRHPYTVGLLGAMRALESSHAGGANEEGGRLQEIPGTVPPLGRRPDACEFADRCARAQGRCRAIAPQLLELASGPHAARCWYPHDAPHPAGAPVTSEEGEAR
jgi:peptide/nickel transport system ATP-binding protein